MAYTRNSHVRSLSMSMLMLMFLLLVVVVVLVPINALEDENDANTIDVGTLYDDHSSRIVLESFDTPYHTWNVKNDPVMGGASTGTFTVNDKDGIATFEGEVVDVPFLHAPGFLQALTTPSIFPDVSQCQGIELILRSNIPYTGFRVSFGSNHAPGGKYYAFGYKADLKINNESTATATAASTFSSIFIPFSKFTDFWDDATGNAIHTCDENPLYCPDEETLQNMGHFAIWAEGVSGPVSLDIQSISAVGCSI